MGYDDPVKAFKVSLGKQQYKCPICIVGSTYDAIHLALKALEMLSKPVAPAEGGVQFDGDALANVEVHDVSGDNVSGDTRELTIIYPFPQVKMTHTVSASNVSGCNGVLKITYS